MSQEPLRFDHQTPDPLDIHRHHFLSDLDDADFTITDFEAEFLESNIVRKEFTPKQREIIDLMRKKYEHKL